MDYIMGISGAGSVTNVSIANISGVVVQSFTVGAINFFFANEDEVTHNLAEAFVTAQMAGYPVNSCRQVCAGVAGMQNARESVKLGPTLRGVMRRCGYTGDALLLGDEQIALAGALGDKDGAILLADETSACFGRNKLGQTHRTGGLGRMADDDGSSYAIGREILRSVARAADGRGSATYLTGPVFRKFNLMSQDDLARLMRSEVPSEKDVCELASALSAACQARDRVALGIVELTVDQLISLVNPVVIRLRMQEGTLAVAGDVLLKDTFIGMAFKKAMAEKYPKIQCVPPHSDGASGAVLLAKKRLALRGYCS